MTTRGVIDDVTRCDAVVVGSGLAGLAAALQLAPRRVTVLSKTPLGRGGSSAHARGGIAAAIGPGDSPAAHADDTVAVAGELADAVAVNLVTTAAPKSVAWLLELGAELERDATGRLALGREAGHRDRRILHAGGDATGAELLRALREAALRAAHTTVPSSRATATELLMSEGRVVGVVAEDDAGTTTAYLAPAVVLATGGIGATYSRTTNPPEATGDGLAIAARAGAGLIDLEFVQFHPTALAVGEDPMPLLTEALRGEGARLVDQAGRPFMLREHPDGDLAPRDVVARAIWSLQRAGRAAYLDSTAVPGVATRFPSAAAAAAREGFDIAVDPLPVSPAAHYHMGGIATDLRGRASLPGLWACGEVACTGVHGANRLGSNSLIEALVFGARVADDITSAGDLPAPRTVPEPLRAVADTDGDDVAVVQHVRSIMWDRVGLVRDEDGLRTALAEFAQLTALPPATPQAGNLLTVGQLVARAALARRESRGAHYRRDFPLTDERWRRRLSSTYAQANGARETA